MCQVTENLSRPRGKLHAAFVDFQKAFDSVDRSLLLTKLRTRFNVGGPIFNLIRNLLCENLVNVTDGCTSSGPITQNIGVIQGDSLSPYLFILFIDDVTQHLEDAGVRTLLYADNLALTANMGPEHQTALESLGE